MINLRRYQDDCVGAIRACMKNLVDFILLVLPTGGGKTIIFTYLSHRMALKDKKVLILVHRVELLRQTSKALAKFDVEHGMINPSYSPNFGLNVQVASVQTIIRRLNYFLAVNWVPDAIIVDEAHHATAGSWRKTINHFKEINPDIVVIGVTATPTRADGQGLGVDFGGMFKELVLGPPPKWMMEQGFLVKAKVLSPPKQFDASQLKRGKGDYNPDELANLINKKTITGNVVEHYKEVCPGVPTIVFCTNVAHTEEVAQEFRDNGFRFYAIDGTTDDDVRKRVLDGLADGSVQGVCSCDLINEGTDVPAATCAILLRLTSSLSLHLQQVGRVLRPVYAEGYDLEVQEERLAAIANSEKPYAYVLDHVGNIGNWVDGSFIENHGLPDKLHEWSLEGEIKKKRSKKAEKSIRVQQCLSCFAVHEPQPVCPECGHVYEIKDNSPKKVSGQLQEVTADMVIKKEIDAKKQAGKIEVAKATTIEELMAIAGQRGFSPNWAHIQMGLKQKKENARLEKIQARLDLQKSQEINFEEVEETDLVEELEETVIAGEFDEDLDF